MSRTSSRFPSLLGLFLTLAVGCSPGSSRPGRADGALADGRTDAAVVDARRDAGRSDGPAGGGPLEATPGRHDLPLVVDGTTRWLGYYIPKRYDAAKPVPMIVAFHGGNGGTNNMFETRGDLLAEADAKAFIVVFPNGQNKDDHKGSSVWNAGYCCAASYAGLAQDDVRFARELVARLSSGLAVDPKRVHAMGFSNGGILIHKIASEQPELFASAVTMSCAVGGKPSATAPLEVPTAKGAFTIAHLHGMSDTHVNYLGGPSSDKAERTDLSFADTVGHWVKASGCNPTPTKQTATGKKGKIFIDTYAGCSSGKEVRGISVENHAHAWADVDSAGFDGTAQGVDFLLAHPRP